jgi:hypothetical protein
VYAISDRGCDESHLQQRQRYVPKKIAVAFFGFFVFYSLYSQLRNVQLSVFTDTTLFKYASVTFIDKSDTVKKFTTITDTLGNCHMSVFTSVDGKRLVLPSSVELAQNYLNPFSSSTAISYQINNQSDVNITIYDILGIDVKNVVGSIIYNTLH